ncbi:MAG: hypothetical protein WBC05_08670 [Sedimentisphaerales bacterium]
MKLICEANGAVTSMFTDGGVYEAEHFKNDLYKVIDNLGHSRYVIPGNLSPFLKVDTLSGHEKCVGRFITALVEENVKKSPKIMPLTLFKIKFDGIRDLVGVALVLATDADEATRAWLHDRRTPARAYEIFRSIETVDGNNFHNRSVLSNAFENG